MSEQTFRYLHQMFVGTFALLVLTTGVAWLIYQWFGPTLTAAGLVVMGWLVLWHATSTE